MTSRPCAAAVLAMFVIAGTAGCADSSPGTQGDARSISVEEVRAGGGDEQQAAVFEDGVVTFDEYEAAFGRYFACIVEHGGEVDNRGVVMRNGVKSFDFTTSHETAAKEMAAEEACYRPTVLYVDIYWQTQHPDLLAYQERRAEALRPALEACLAQAGVPMEGAAYQDMVDEAMRRGISEAPGADCLDRIGHETWAG